MKIKIAGWLLVITGAITLAVFIFIVVGGRILLDLDQFLIGLFCLIFGIFYIILGSALKGCRKWAWYAGIVIISFAIIGNLIMVFLSFSMPLLVALLLDIFIIYALVSEKRLFFPSGNSVK